MIRLFFAYVCSLFLLSGVAVAEQSSAPAVVLPPAQSISLWPQQAPGGDMVLGEERSNAVGTVHHVVHARMEIYRPSRPNGTAVLIIAGGGYAGIAIGHESQPAARWLLALGVTPVILYYRLPADGWLPVAPFQDAQRAMRLLRAQAGKLQIDPQHIGVLGFSAGGNLAGITATRFSETFYAAVDDADRLSSRPDFAGLIYPVISLRAPFNTTRSSHHLALQPDSVSAYSVELHVDQGTPPTFLAQAADDPIANIGNSLLMFDALHRQKIPVALHIFPSGGHGWGIGKPGTLETAWPQLFADWATSCGFPLATVARTK